MKKNVKDEKIIPEYYSPVRYVLSHAKKDLSYHPIANFSEAKNTENAVVIMEGDSGGQIYLTCPMKLVKCDEKTLEKLLDYLDDIAWACNEGDGKGIYYEIKQPMEGVWGGMGGGIVLDELWVHDNFEEIKDKIKNVIDGKEQELD